MVASIVDFFVRLFDTSDFPARWNCGHWTSGHGWLHILSDLAVWGAYTTIPIALVLFALRRKNVPRQRIYLLFAAFILACGSVHLVEAIIFYWPIYRVSGVLKLLTAVVSWATVVAIVRIAPQAFDLPALKSTNDELRDEIHRKDLGEQRLRLATHLANVGIVDIDLAENTWTCDEIAARLYGLPTGQVAAIEQFFDSVHPEDLPDVRQKLGQLSTDRQGQLISEHRVVDGGTTIRWLRVAMQRNAEQGEAENSKRALLAVLDVTESREREEVLRVAKIEAESANFARREFLANMSHEIRTPMAALMGHADILLAHLTDPDNRQCALTIKRNGKHLLELLNDILDLSRIEAGRFQVAREQCDVVRLLADIESLMHVRVRDENVEFRVMTTNPVPQFIETDKKRLRQILLNLVGNALKFTKRGHVEVRAIFDGQAGTLSFEIEDTGIGIPADVQGQLFEPFSQGDTSRTRRFGGSGLGLAISKRLAEMLGGGIAMHSTEGVGSTFTVTLPVEAGARTALVSMIPSRHLEEESPPLERLSGRYLLVDDRRDMRFMGQHFLEEAGADVSTASNGLEAIRMVEESERAGLAYTLIVMDMQMPVMDGHTAVSSLRSAGCRTPILALTADAMPEDRERCLNSGCDEYLAKPLEAEQLVRLCCMLTTESSMDDLAEARTRRKRQMMANLPEKDRSDTEYLLLVEDNSEVAELTGYLLEQRGIPTEISYTGTDAIEHVAAREPAAILLDLGLPDMSGFEVARRLRERGFTGQIVALTGRDAEEVAEEARDAGIDHHRTKTGDIDELSTFLRSIASFETSSKPSEA